MLRNQLLMSIVAIKMNFPLNFHKGKQMASDIHSHLRFATPEKFELRRYGILRYELQS